MRSGKTEAVMNPRSTKRMLRIEKKKKKMAALLEISKLNEHDRENRSKRITTENHILKEDIVANKESEPKESEPSPKRIRTEEMNIENDEKTTILVGPSGKPLLVDEEFAQLKAELRLKTKKMRSQPVFRLREIGENAKISLDINDRVPIFLSDIQHLLMYSQIGHHSPYSPARWCQLEKFPKVQQTCVLIVENISLYHFQAHESSFPFLGCTFQHKLEMVAPSAYKGDIVADLTMVPLTATQVRKYITEFGTLETAVIESDCVYDRIKDLFPVQNHPEINANMYESRSMPSSDKFPRTHLLLSGWQMVEENFPLPIKGLMETKYAGYVLTKEVYKDVTPFSPMFGLDCEMCRTTSGDLELTRVSIVNEELKLIYEELVKPDNKITDYLTRFSGITPKLMKNVTKRLEDVQKDIQNLLPPDAILVGQSLGNDLHALKIMHPYVIDTSVIYNLTGDRSRKTKLQILAREFLSQRIQEGKGGHCSVEDSIAALQLVQLKLKSDIYFGDAVMSGVSVKQNPELGHPHFATSAFNQITKVDKTVSVVALEDLALKYEYFVSKGNKNKEENKSKINIMANNCNKTVVKQSIDIGHQYTMSITHIRVSEVQLEKDNNKTFRNIDKWIKDKYEATPAPGLCVVIFGGQKETGNGCCFIKVKNSF